MATRGCRGGGAAGLVSSTRSLSCGGTTLPGGGITGRGGGATGFSGTGAGTCSRAGSSPGGAGCATSFGSGASEISAGAGGSAAGWGVSISAGVAVAGAGATGLLTGSGGGSWSGSSMMAGFSSTGFSAPRAGVATSTGWAAGGPSTPSGLCGASASGGAAGLGASDLAVLTRRGGGSVEIGFGGSAFLAGTPLRPLCPAGVSANMSPPGRAMLRCLASLSTNWRATTSSIVLDALRTSMPWSRFSSATTSWLVVPSNSATLYIRTVANAHL